MVLVSHQRGWANGKHRVTGLDRLRRGLPRQSLFVADPDDPTGRRVLMLDNGGNVPPLAQTIAYAIEDHGRVPAVAWLPGPIPTTIARPCDTCPL